LPDFSDILSWMLRYVFATFVTINKPNVNLEIKKISEENAG